MTENIATAIVIGLTIGWVALMVATIVIGSLKYYQWKHKYLVDNGLALVIVPDRGGPKWVRVGEPK